MAWIRGRDAVTGDTWLSTPSVQRVSAPERVIYDKEWREQIEEHERTQPRVGFAPAPVVTEPLLWDGDNA